MHFMFAGISLNIASEIFSYIVFFALLATVIYTYIKTPKPFLRGTIGIIAILVITVLYFVAIIFFPHSRYLPAYRHTAPIVELFTISYLTLVRKPNRVVFIIMAVLLAMLVAIYILAVLFP